jgi:orotate phosphoribosyltransferase
MRHLLRAADPRHESLLARLYEAASVDLAPRAEPAPAESYVTRSGRRLAWALDLRRPLLRAEHLRPAAAAVAERLRSAGATQVAGKGMGAAPLVCGVVAAGCGIDGALLRDRPKERGFLRPFEGELDRGRPVWLLDDIVNTGRSTGELAGVLRGEGFEVAAVLCLFHYSWGPGRARLARLGLPLAAMAVLAKRPGRVFAAERIYGDFGGGAPLAS